MYFSVTGWSFLSTSAGSSGFQCDLPFLCFKTSYLCVLSSVKGGVLAVCGHLSLSPEVRHLGLWHPLTDTELSWKDLYNPVIFFALKSTFSDIKMATPHFFPPFPRFLRNPNLKDRLRVGWSQVCPRGCLPSRSHTTAWCLPGAASHSTGRSFPLRGPCQWPNMGRP